MVTASHNPWGWSGFKHAYDYSTTLVGRDVAELRAIVENGEFLQGKGAETFYPDIVAAYTSDVLRKVGISRPLKVLVDTGNGTAGLFAPGILRQAGCEVIEQYTDVSETRHHEANPSTLGMLEAMAAGVRAHGADIGLGFDDDGDRLGAVDEKGEIIWPDKILILLARLVLKKHPGGKVVFDVKCSEALAEDVSAHGGVPIMWITGHSYIKDKAKEVRAVLAGERSGHIYLPTEHYAFDDALFAGLKLLEYLSSRNERMSEVLAELPQYVTSPVWHAACADEVKYAVVERLVADFKKTYGPERVIDINGARVYLQDGWGLVRASSNLPVLSIVFEAKTAEGLKNIEAIFREKLAALPEVGSEWVSG